MANQSSELLFAFVHYRTPERMHQAVLEARQELERTGLRFEIIVVDNSGDLGDDFSQGSELCRVLSPGCNLGYAGAANLAFRDAQQTGGAERAFALCNPDVILLPGALSSLMEELPGAAAVGPAFFWDAQQRIQLPPTEPVGASWVDSLARVLGGSSQKRVRRQWRRASRRHWLARHTIDSTQLSGALLVFDREALLSVGPLDENFRLYFEETDWLQRASRQGHVTRFVPKARAIHTFDASAQKEPRACQWFADSEALFRRRYRVARVREENPSSEKPAEIWTGSTDLPSQVESLWFELSASSGRYPAAVEQLADQALVQATHSDGRVHWQPPAELSQRVEGWWLTLTDERARELAVFRLEGDLK